MQTFVVNCEDGLPVTDTPDVDADVVKDADVQAILDDDTCNDAQKRYKICKLMYDCKEKCYEKVKLEATNQVDLDKLKEMKPKDPLNIPDDPLSIPTDTPSLPAGSIVLTDLKDPKLVVNICDDVNKECKRYRDAIQSN